jgi:hypothetical protein
MTVPIARLPLDMKRARYDRLLSLAYVSRDKPGIRILLSLCNEAMQL